MAEIERGTRSSTTGRWLALAAAALLFGVLVGLVIPHPYRWPRPAPFSVNLVGPAEPFVLSDWEYPGAISLLKMEGGSTSTKESAVSTVRTFAPSLYAYATPDSLETVWRHYAKLSGIGDQEFRPGGSKAKTDFNFSASSSGVSGAMGEVLYYTGDHDRQAVRSATIVKRRPGYTVAVFISRGKDEERTYINIVVQKHSYGPKS